MSVAKKKTGQGFELGPKTTPTDGRPEKEAIEQRIATQAYALYEERGRREGYAVRDWLDAEYLVNQEIYEAH